MDRDLQEAIKYYRESPIISNAYKLCGGLVRSGFVDQGIRIEPISSQGSLTVIPPGYLNFMVELNKRNFGFCAYSGRPIYLCDAPESDGSRTQYINDVSSTQQEGDINYESLDQYASYMFSMEEIPENIDSIPIHISSRNRNDLLRFYSYCLEDYLDRTINLLNYWVGSGQDPLVTQLTAETYLQHLNRNELIATSEIGENWWLKEKPRQGPILGIDLTLLETFSESEQVKVPPNFRRMFDAAPCIHRHYLVKTASFHYHFYWTYDNSAAWPIILGAVVDTRAGQMFCNEIVPLPVAMTNHFTALLTYYQKISKGKFVDQYILVNGALLQALFS